MPFIRMFRPVRGESAKAAHHCEILDVAAGRRSWRNPPMEVAPVERRRPPLSTAVKNTMNVSAVAVNEQMYVRRRSSDGHRIRCGRLMGADLHEDRRLG
jgi:hypothetical protein